MSFHGSKIGLWVLVGITLVAVLLTVAFVGFMIINNDDEPGTSNNSSDDSSSSWIVFIPIFGTFPAIFLPLLASKEKERNASAKEKNRSNRYSNQTEIQSRQEYYTSRPSTPPTRKYCSNCAASIAPDSRYCEYCGAKVE
ncbi:MAG: zinc-ribbon domain-containing protein [Candidatus Hermodarchaeota archaeon]